jgi:hypothetical protein
MVEAYESKNRRIAVLECMAVHNETRITEWRGAAHVGRLSWLFPFSYDRVAARYPTHLVPLHNSPQALRVWRPLFYRLGGPQGLTRFGSQHELEWRWALYLQTQATQRLFSEMLKMTRRLLKRRGLDPGRLRELVDARLDGLDDPDDVDLAGAVDEFYRRERALYDSEPPPEWVVARDRADAYLRDALSPQQRLDLAADDCFYVPGELNKLYSVRLGNGAGVVDPETRVELVSICYHPDAWMPHADVALATKLLIESGREGEEILLSEGQTRVVAKPRPATKLERELWKREQEIAA